MALGPSLDLQLAQTVVVANQPRVLSGIDVLVERHSAPLTGHRIGLVTNQTGRDANGRRTIDLLATAAGLQLLAIFTPEHGLNANRDGAVESARDETTGLPMYSLYGSTRRPTESMLAQLDTIVVDLQDAGVRFYTYPSTVGYVLEEAAKRDLAVYLFDRPDPINAAIVQGPVLDPRLRSFTGYFPPATAPRHDPRRTCDVVQRRTANRCAADLADPDHQLPPLPLDSSVEVDDVEHLIEHHGTLFRIHVDEGCIEPSAVLLPLDQFFENRATAAIRLWRGLAGRNPGPNPAALPKTRQDRLILALRALDGRLADATYRDIASALFGEAGLPDHGWKTHDLRDRTIRLVRFGLGLMRSGYRRLLLYPYRRR